MITQERLRELLDYDPETGLFVWLQRDEIAGSDKIWNKKHAGKTAGYLSGLGYRPIKIDGHKYLAHRLAWLYVNGRWPAAFIDHINGNRADNRIANLREATQSQNQQNRGLTKHNTSGRKGVSWRRDIRKWSAQIAVSSKQIFLGYFTCPDAAAAAYEAAARKYHGEFARAA